MENITGERIYLLFTARGSLRWLKRKFFYLDGLEDVIQFPWDSVVVQDLPKRQAIFLLLEALCNRSIQDKTCLKIVTIFLFVLFFGMSLTSQICYYLEYQYFTRNKEIKKCI